MGNLEAIAQRLCDHGLAVDTPVAVIQDGTRPTQRTVVGTLASIAADVEREGLAAPAIVVIGSVVSLREELAWFDAGPLFGKRVLVTRPAHQAGEFAAALYARGAQPILAPTIAIGPGDVAAIDDTLHHLETFEWAIFTSRNAVDAVFDRLDAMEYDARQFALTKIVAIGPKTALALRQRGIRANLVPDRFVGEAAAAALIEVSQPGDRVAIFGAKDAPDRMPLLLNAAKRPTTTIAAYVTTHSSNATLGVQVAACDILTFASGSSVDGFARALGGPAHAVTAAHGKIVACIGPVTAKVALDLGLGVNVIAGEYTGEGLVDALEEFLQSARS